MNDCCKDVENLREGAGPRGLDAPLSEEVVVRHCAVCTCRHFEVEADPGELGVLGASL